MSLPKIYLSGRFVTSGAIEKAWLKASKCKYRCFSFANLCPEFKGYYSNKIAEGYQVCLDEKIGVMMDSGAHSFHVILEQSKRRNEKAARKNEIDIEALKDQVFDWYAAFAKKNKKKWDLFITLDYRRHQPTILAMQKKFHEIGLKPMPVYHGDHGIEWLLKHKDMGHDYICIASAKELRPSYKSKRYFFDRLFDFGAKHGIKYHGLAFTSIAFMTFYPWESVDSSNWSKTAAFGMINFPDFNRNILSTLHVSDKPCTAMKSYNDLDKKNQSKVRAYIRDLGFDFDYIRKTSAGRHDWNGYVFSNLEELGLDLKKAYAKKSTWGGLI